MSSLLIKQIVSALSELEQGAFEALCSLLLPKVSDEFIGLEPNNRLTKTRNGVPDAFKICEDGKYIAFQYTSQQDGIRNKVIKDIQDISRANIGNKVKKVVICTNTPLLAEDHKLYISEAQSLAWDFEIFSLHRLADSLQRHPDYCLEFLRIQIPITDNEFKPRSAIRLYDAGSSIKSIREEMGLTTSEFIELIEYHSEKSLKEIESMERECDIALLERISRETGSSLDWLKHQKGTKYQTEYLYHIYYESAIQKIISLEPEEIFVVLEKANYRIGVILRRGVRYYIFETSINLEFWLWIEDFGDIQYIFKFLSSIYQIMFSEKFTLVHGCIIPPPAFSDIFAGERYPGINIKIQLPSQRYWLEDFLNIRSGSRDEIRRIYGDWIIKAQDMVIKHK